MMTPVPALVSQLEDRNGAWLFKSRSAAPSLESGLRPAAYYIQCSFVSKRVKVVLANSSDTARKKKKKRRYECVCDACRQTTTWVEKLAAHKFCPSKGDHGP